MHAEALVPEPAVAVSPGGAAPAGAPALFRRAFDLAFFIHGDKAVALEVAASALAKLRLAATAQGRRLAYVPKGRPRGGEGALEGRRTRVLVTDLHLLQRLVYIESEPYERWDERAGGADPSEMTLRYVKHLVRIGLRRHSLYVALGLGRLLLRYSTVETQELYSLVVQDPGRVPDDDYCRSRKRQLMAELGRRFGDALRVVQGSRGEQQFETCEDPDAMAALVGECLERFTPWDTPCTVPESFDPRTTELPALASHGQGPDAEHPIEVGRIHALVHPVCHRGLRRALGLGARPLAIPRFHLAGGRRPPPPRRPPPGLGADDWQWVARRLAEEDGRRGRGGLLRVMVDGEERARLDLARAERVEIEVGEEAEVVELRRAEGALLAVCLLDGECRERRVRLSGGLEVSFRWRPIAGHEPRGFWLELGCRPTRAWRAAGWALRRRAAAALALIRLAPASVTPRRALATSALAALVTALVVRGPHSWVGQEAAPPPAPPSVASTRPPDAGHDLPAPAPRPSARPHPEETTRELDVGAPGRPLAEVRAILVATSGDGPAARRLREALVREIEASERFVHTGDPAAADALLTGSIAAPAAARDARLRVSLTLVNARGDRLWSSRLEEDGGAVEERMAGMARRAVDRLQRAAAAAGTR